MAYKGNKLICNSCNEEISKNEKYWHSCFGTHLCLDCGSDFLTANEDIGYIYYEDDAEVISDDAGADIEVFYEETNE